jgi:hypothetical protein
VRRLGIVGFKDRLVEQLISEEFGAGRVKITSFIILSRLLALHKACRDAIQLSCRFEFRFNVSLHEHCHQPMTRAVISNLLIIVPTHNIIALL